jgi:hypothetical protein
MGGGRVTPSDALCAVSAVPHFGSDHVPLLGFQKKRKDRIDVELIHQRHTLISPIFLHIKGLDSVLRVGRAPFGVFHRLNLYRSYCNLLM